MAYTAEQLQKYWAENPEALAEAIRSNPDAWDLGLTEPAYSTENQTTGYSDDANKLTFWDPNAGENGGYVTQDMTDATFQEKMAFRDDVGLGYYTNANGDYVYGIKPTSMYQTSLGADDTTMSEGVDPNWQPYTVPDMNGIGRGNPILDDSGATTGYDGGGQRTPENTEIYDTLPNSEYQGWQGSTSHDRDGNIIPGGPADPNSRPVYERGDPFIGSVNDTFGANAGGMNTLDPGYQSNIQGNDLERFGYDSSSNQDFYQRQFADMRAQQMRQDDREGQAREAAITAANAPQGEAFGGDPWSWANLPDIVQGGGGEGQDPNEWIFNPNYGINEQTTNSELMMQMGSLPAFNDEDQRWFTEFADSDQNQNSTNWVSDGKQHALDWLSNSDLSADNVDRLNTVFNNTWTQAGNAPTPGGMMVPVGYASPTNA